MSFPFSIPNGQIEVTGMSGDYIGGLILVRFYDGSGNLVTPVGTPTFTRSANPSGSTFVPINQHARGEWRFNGPANRVKVSLSGVTGYSTYDITVWRYLEPISLVPDGAFSGMRAMITRPYTEANVKLGTQFNLRIAWPTSDVITLGAPRKIHFQTGAKTVIVKLRDFHYSAEEMSLSLYSNPTGVTGGTAVPIGNYNTKNPQATTMTVRRGVTTVSDGTLIEEPEYFFGSSNAPQRSAGSIPVGRERVLAPNSNFLVVVAVTAGGAGATGRAQYYLDWYEGDTDLPLGL